MIKNDFIASIVVFLVAIPLCLGVALASGAPPMSGIISGIIGGIIVGLLSQSSVSVSGPAAGMIPVVIATIATLGSFHAFLFALCLAGVLQILMGILRAGFIASYIPLNVIEGLLAAIGILIIIKQIPFAFGYFAEPQALYASLKEAEGGITLLPLQHVFSHMSLGATFITLFSFVILIAWQKIPYYFSKIIPAPIIAVIVAVILNHIFSLYLPILSLNNSHLVSIPSDAGIFSLFKGLQHPDFSDFLNYKTYLSAGMLAIIASLETLLNIQAIEKIDRRHRHAAKNRELVAQGCGNILSGLFGGIPITSVIIRSSVNIYAGAKTKLSTIFHGCLLFLSVTFLAKYLNQIPVASLAAILLFTGYKLASIRLFKENYARGWNYFLPFIVSVIAILLTNLLAGVLIGLGVSFFFILKQNSQVRLLTVNELHPSGEVLRIVLPQQLTFLSKATIVENLDKLGKNLKLILDANSTEYIDDDVLEVIKEFQQYQAVEKNITLNLEGFKDYYQRINQTNFITATTYDIQSTLTPRDVLALLKEGNQRFIKNTPIHKNYPLQIVATAQSQHPMTVMLSCIDSRVPVELIFDLNVGDAFVIRIAGNILNEDIIASMEFACDVAGAKLIVVLGHENCGAIRAACDHFSRGHIRQLLEKIEPAIEKETKTHVNRTGKNPEFVSHVTALNVDIVKENIYEKSEILKKLIDEKSIGIVGAIYDVATGQVIFKDNQLS
jgi:carbonic anhydrase